MDLTSDLKPFQDQVTSSLLDLTRTAGRISAEDLSFHRSSSGSLSNSLDAQNSRLLQLTQKLLQAATSTGTSLNPPRVHDAEDVDDNWRGIVDVVDDLLERADACLDEYTGVIRRFSPAVQDGSLTLTTAKDNRPEKFPSLFSSRQLAKPQLLFEKGNTNHETAAFKPLLRTKPHSIIPLDESVGDGERDGYNHPYATEIEQSSYPEAVYTRAKPVPPIENEVTFVDTREGVEEMLAELRKVTELAIDLEHHDTHSYVGIVCLMQISTRQRDWVIDTLVPWRGDLQILNEVFADPKILKVFQGSTMDVIWLQRDLGLYVVGLFDTFHASTALGFPQKSLKYLLERFCAFHANKKYQMADWRIRPIPEEMLDYARSDTHYLLSIYDNLRNMLLEASTSDNNLIKYVLEESKKEALQRYERAVYDVERGLGPVGWFAPLARRSIRFTPEQFGVYRAVHAWRDRKARLSDEGVMFIMSQATLFAVAEAMPTTVPALIGITNPVSKAIKEASRELVEIIKTGKDTGREGPTLADVMRENEAFLPRKRNHRRLAERAQQDQGVGATLQMLSANGDVGSSAERTLESRFWGSAKKASPVATSRLSASLDDAMRLVLPLPELDAASFITSAPPTSSEPAAETFPQPSPHLSSFTKKPDSPQTLVLKEVDQASKRTADEAARAGHAFSSTPAGRLEVNAGHFPLSDSPTDLGGPMEETKPRRKQRKVSPEAEAKSKVPTEPFDYANAASILHAKSDLHPPNGPARAQEHFSSYGKALDAPRGLKRARRETAGKSFTFKK